MYYTHQSTPYRAHYQHRRLKLQSFQPSASTSAEIQQQLQKGWLEFQKPDTVELYEQTGEKFRFSIQYLFQQTEHTIINNYLLFRNISITSFGP
jgi:hypothetical protein